MSDLIAITYKDQAAYQALQENVAYLNQARSELTALKRGMAGITSSHFIKLWKII